MPKRSFRPRAAAISLAARSFWPDLHRWLAPGQVHVAMLGRDLHPGLRRAAEVERRVGPLHRREEEARILDREMRAGVVHRLARHQPAPDLQELAGDGIAGGVVEEDAVALELDRVAAGDDVDEQAAARDPVQRRRHPRRHRGLLQPRPHGHEEAQALGQRDEGAGDDPAVLAAAARGQQDAVIAELVHGLRYLAQVGERGLARPDRGAEIAAVAVGRDEPEDVGLRCRLGLHAPGLQAASLTSMGLGIRPILWKASAISCCLARTSAVTGATP